MSKDNADVLKLPTGDTTPVKVPLPTGPIEGVKYPLKVVYCGECRFVDCDLTSVIDLL